MVQHEPIKKEGVELEKGGFQIMKTQKLIAATIVAAGLTAPLFAATNEGTSNTPTTVNANSTTLTGMIQSIDRQDNRVRIKDASGTVTEYKVDDRTDFRRGEDQIKFGDVKPGNAVAFIADEGMIIEKLSVPSGSN